MSTHAAISVVAPPGWGDVAPTDDRGIRELVAPAGTGFRASLVLTHFVPPAGTPSTLEAVHRAALDDLAQTMTDGFVTSESTALIGELPTLRSTVEFRQGRFRVVATVATWSPGAPRVAVGLCERDRPDDLATIQAALGSITDTAAPA